VDGAFPSVVNPIAIWEIKGYYYTTTFGSRVADGVYETLLDGMELEELETAAQRKVQHVLFIDDHYRRSLYMVGVWTFVPMPHDRYASHGLCR
jgi:hypothetical protein